MVWMTGAQSIPAELLDLYRGTLTEKQPDGVSRKRYPFRVPHMQAGGADVKPAQLIQRNRFKAVIARFNATSDAERARWYAARPPWSSFLWYYNYFIMSGLMDVLGANPEGASVINTIKHYTFAMASGAPANITVAITEINPEKAAVFFYGGGGAEIAEGIGVPIYPRLEALNATNIVARAAGQNDIAVICSVSVIEYI